MSQVTIYQKPTCTTCRTVFGILKKKGIDAQSINYYFDPIPKEKLKDLLFKLNMKAEDLLRKKEAVYKELELNNKNLSEDVLVDLMIKHPDLIQRPIVERGGKAIIARPAERIYEII